MAIIKRHFLSSPLRILLAVILLLTPGLVYVMAPAGESVAADAMKAPGLSREQVLADAPAELRAALQDAAATEEALFNQVQAVRGELQLSRRDLASLGLDQAQAERVLQRVKNWCEANGGQLERLEREHRRARLELADTVRAMHAGGKGKGETVASLRTKVGRAKQQRDQFLAAAAAEVEAGLPGEARSMWAAARSNRDVVGDERFASGLTDADKAKIKRRQRLASRPEALKREGANLKVGRDAVVKTVRANRKAKLVEVAAAEQAVLPLPLSSQLEQLDMEAERKAREAVRVADEVKSEAP